jgi:hypothetical protein
MAVYETAIAKPLCAQICIGSRWESISGASVAPCSACSSILPICGEDIWKERSHACVGFSTPFSLYITFSAQACILCTKKNAL